MVTQQKFPPNAGIAIGPILFILALLGVLAAVMASGGGGFQTAGSEDRITNDVVAQANLIRNTINECNLQYKMAVSTGSVNPPASNDYYPTSDTSTGTIVRNITCTPMGGTPMWVDKLLPPPTSGFNEWTYIDAWSATPSDDHGRCFWTTPTSGSTPTVVDGLTRAATKFNSSTAFSSTSEVIYDPSSTSQKFVVWITLPASGTPDSHCVP